MAARRAGKGSAAADVDAKVFNGPDGVYDAARKPRVCGANWWLNPFYKGTWGEFIVFCLTEIFCAFLFVLITLLAYSGLIAQPDRILAGLLLGAISGGAYYLLTGLPTGNRHYRLHLGWLTTAPTILTFHIGPMAGVVYMALDVIGAVIAAGVLTAIQHGGYAVVTLPSTAAGTNLSVTWGTEIAGSLIIVLAMVYVQYLNTTHKQEKEMTRTSQWYFAAARGTLTAIFLQFNSWVWEPVIYIGGVLKTCFDGACTPDVPFGAAPSFYILVPFIGIASALAVYYLFLGIFQIRTHVPRLRERESMVEARMPSSNDPLLSMPRP